MTEFERRIWRQLHSLMDGFSKWFAGMRDTDAAKRAATAVHDLRESDAGKKAATTISDLRDTDAAKTRRERPRGPAAAGTGEEGGGVRAACLPRPAHWPRGRRVLTEYSVAPERPQVGQYVRNR